MQNMLRVSLPPEILEEMNREAERLDRPLSWIARRAWAVAKREIRRLPSDAEATKSANQRR